MCEKRNIVRSTCRITGRAGLCACLLCVAFMLAGCGREKEDTLSLDYALEADRPVQGAGPEPAHDGAAGLETSPEAVAGQASAADAQPPQESRQELICVYVCGAVKEPGVVELPAGSRAQEAVSRAGGMTQEADDCFVNLAARVTDGEKLYIPTVQEAAELIEQQEAQESALVDINTADSAALCTLPGIGESRAADIISFREQNGPFAAAEDIMKVPGIKTNAYEKIKDKIKVSS